MARIHNRQSDDSIIGGQFASGNLYLTKANGVTVIVSPGQSQPTNTYPLNQISVQQNSDYVVSGEFQGSTLVLTNNLGGTISISGGVPDLTKPGMVGQSVHSEQNCESIVGGSIDGSTITLFKYCGDTIVINGYSDSYPDTVGYDVVTTTTTEGPTQTTTTSTTLNPFDPTTTTTTTSVENITTTTTYAGQPPNQFTEVNVGYVDGVVTYYFNFNWDDVQTMYCQAVEWMTMDAYTNFAGSAKKYFGDFKVGTMVYSWQNLPEVSVTGYRFVNLPVYGLSIIYIFEGVVQSITRVGTRHFYNGPNGELTQGEIYTDNNLYGTCS